MQKEQSRLEPLCKQGTNAPMNGDLLNVQKEQTRGHTLKQMKWGKVSMQTKQVTANHEKRITENSTAS